MPFLIEGIMTITDVLESLIIRVAIGRVLYSNTALFMDALVIASR